MQAIMLVLPMATVLPTTILVGAITGILLGVAASTPGIAGIIHLPSC